MILRRRSGKMATRGGFDKTLGLMATAWADGRFAALDR
jgi:hypothetical protein